MSAAATSARLPLYEEGIAFWEQLTDQCKRHVDVINNVVSENELPSSHCVEWAATRHSVLMQRSELPSTEIRLNLGFEHWGPKISGSVRGLQEEDLRFYPEEFEFMIGQDPDDGTVAISTEGRSLCPSELAKYVAQNFRRCYPGLSLPCPDCEWEQP